VNDGVIVTMRHIRQAGWCAAGARVWALHHDLDILEFVRHGIPVEELEATGDHFALTVCAIARAERRDG
jgi:hypothetical protein